MSNKTAKFIKNKDRPEVAGLSTKVAVDWVKVADGSPELADGRFILKMTKCVNHFTLLSFTYERRGTYLISRQPTQFQPPHFSIFGQFLVSFSFRTIFAPTAPRTILVSKDVEFCPLPKRPRKNFKMVSRFSLPRKLVRVWYQIKWFFKRYNLSYSDSSFIPWGRKALKSRNSTYSPVFFYLQRHNTVFMTKNNLFSS